MDEHCYRVVLDSTAENKVVRGDDSPVDYSKRVIAAEHQCNACEKGWTQTHENAHWEHCQTPIEIKITFSGITKCEHDPPYPDPPNNHEFILPHNINGGGCLGGCYWNVDEIINGKEWDVRYCVYYKENAHTALLLQVSDRGDGFRGVYFSLDADPDPYGPCYPLQTGDKLDNQRLCSEGYCGQGGKAKVEW